MNINNVQKAWNIATHFHKGQKYGGKAEGEDVAYINHVGAVAFELMNAFRFEPNKMEELGVLSALLHDTIEDTACTYENIEKEFGKAVAEGVLALTKDDTLESKPAKMLDSLERIREQPEVIWMVKLADRIVNLSSVPYYWNNEKIAAYRKEGQFILDYLGDSSEYLAGRLKRRIQDYGKEMSQG